MALFERDDYKSLEAALSRSIAKTIYETLPKNNHHNEIIPLPKTNPLYQIYYDLAAERCANVNPDYDKQLFNQFFNGFTGN